MAQDVQNHLNTSNSAISTISNSSVDAQRFDPVRNTFHWWCLTQLRGLGRQAISQLLLRHPNDWHLFFQSDNPLLSEAPAELKAAINRIQFNRFEELFSWRDSAAERFVLQPDDDAYPPLLRQINRPPWLLYGQGATDTLRHEQVAVVGTRNPSRTGTEQAHMLASELARVGWTVTSGLALGIDGVAHRAALEAGGPTLAVLGCGPDIAYPKRHQALAAEIVASGGAVISEFAPGTAPKAQHFPQRNRIVSGLCRGVLVIEAAVKSGSLITARHALEQDREVFAVPANILNPMSRGCHYLIKQGAKLVESVEDILEEFVGLVDQGAATGHKNLQKKQGESLASDKLLDSVEYEVTAMDAVIQRSGMSIKDVSAKLLEYELRGLVASVPGGYIKLRGK